MQDIVVMIIVVPGVGREIPAKSQKEKQTQLQYCRHDMQTAFTVMRFPGMLQAEAARV
jgi:hypothetical protein